MKWFRNHQKTAVLVVVFMVLAVIVVASYSNEGSSSALGRTVQRVVTFVQKPFAGIGNGVESGLKGIFQFRTIVKENDALKETNAALKSENIKLKLNQKELEELRSLSKVLNYEGIQGNYSPVTADVISMDGSNWMNIFTINAGSERGITKDSIVMDGYGLIGRVLETGAGWSKVVSVIDESNSVSFKVEHGQEEALLGVLSGDGKGGLTGFMLNPDAIVAEGELLVTTGMGLYPEGIAIGKVDKVEMNKDTLLKTLTIEPSVNFNSIEKATVILRTE